MCNKKSCPECSEPMKPLRNGEINMEIYNIIVEDRHNDVEVRSFRDREKAIETAKEIAKSLNRHIEDLKEEFIEEWEFCMEYSCEGECVRVVKTIME